MIKSINYETTVKNLAKFLDTYSGLAPDRILNADSVRGTNLSELITPTQAYSPEVSTSFLLFELIENQNGDNFITKGDHDNEMLTIQTYDFHLMIYGNSSPNDAQKISALFKQAEIALGLRDLGVYIKGVSPIEAINEFINDTLLLRRDLMIQIQTKHEFNDIGPATEYFDDAQSVSLVVNVAK